MIRIILASLAITIGSAASGEPSRADSEFVDPADCLDRVDPEQRTFLRRMTPYYTRLPDGRCVSIFREVHLWHEENKISGVPTLVKAESFDYEFPNTEPDSSVRHEFAGDVPSPTGHGIDYFFASGLQNGSRLKIVDTSNPDRVRAMITNGGVGTPPSILVTGIPEVRRTSLEVNRPVFLWREDAGDAKKPPLYRYVDAIDSRPTAGELAMAVAEGKAELFSYRVVRTEYQKKKKQGEIWKRKVSDGPLVVTHTWERRPIELRLRSLVAGAPAAEPQPTPDFEQFDATDEIRLADGREFRGRFVSETADQIIFEVIIGRARGQMSFARDEVIEVVRPTDGAADPDKDG